jgi:hypothetical protein
MRKSDEKAKKHKKTKGTLLAERGRAEANKLTDTQRESLTVAAMKFFYGGAVRAHAHRG